MASNDVRDILDVSVAKEARPSKKAKVSAQQKSQLAGLSKEVRGLMMGDGIAPIQVQEAQYKQKPKLLKKVRPWSRAPFRHPLRDDGLILRHWTFHHKEATQPGTPKSHGAPVTPADSKVEQDRETQTPPHPDSEYRFVKYNVKPAMPQYDEQQYEANLQNDDWSKEETDYLMELAKDLELRWVVIWDRYDYRPSQAPQSGDGNDADGDTAMAIATPAKPRSMEDLKYRYYQVAAKMMAIHNPLSGMSVSEYELYEKMLKFDPNRETTRKKLAVALMARTPEEIREEEILLGELKRIVDNETRFLEERRELYQRLDFPQSQGSISAYESSAGLNSLVMQLHNDRNKLKRRSIADGSAAGPGGAGGASGQQSSHSRQDSTAGAGGRGADQRGGTGSQQQGKPNKKGGSGGGGGAGAHRRELKPNEEAKFGVTHHERLTSGVSFRQGRVEKLVLAKSAAQAQKLHDALAELSVPVKAVMPTSRVCGEYERLIAGIHSLLDARKTSEKMANEIRVLKAQREARERRERGEEDPVDEAAKGEDGEKADGEDKDAQAKNDDDDADAEEDEAEMRRRGRRKEDEEDDEEDEEEDEEADEDKDVEEEDEDDDAEVDASARADNEEDEDEDGEEGDEDNNESVAQADDEDAEDYGGAQADSDEDGGAEHDEDEDDADLDNDEEQAEADVDLSEEEQQDDEDEDEGEDEVQNSDNDDAEEAPAPQPDAKSRKRSVSVLSAASHHSSKRTRR